MNDKEKILIHLLSVATDNGAYKTNIIETKQIRTNRSFRDICESNHCGMYSRCYMCPPDAGNIDKLIEEIDKYDFALVYQTVTKIEDSYDFEGMINAKKHIISITLKLKKVFSDLGISDTLHLGVGGCGICETCAKQTSEPCRFPENAIPSLEAYGINVSELAKSADMKYINGQNTVTYFGAVLFSLDGE